MEKIQKLEKQLEETEELFMQGKALKPELYRISNQLRREREKYGK